MSDSTPKYTCDHPHHTWQAEKAIEAEVASWKLRGLAMLISGLDGLHEHSSYPRDAEMGASMILTDALYGLAEKLEPPRPGEDGRPQKDPEPDRTNLAVVEGGKA